jgi:excisionase family DNA binding protein
MIEILKSDYFKEDAMTGRELIIFIMENHLEDTIIFDSDVLPCLMTIDEAAIALNTGRNTVKALYEIGRLPGVKIGDETYIVKCDNKKEKTC